MIAVGIRANRTAQGAVRRGWIVYNAARRWDFIEALAYIGDDELRAAYPEVTLIDDLSVPVSEYERIKRGKR